MRAILILITILLAGCASVQDTHEESITLNLGYDQAWQAAVAALSATGFSVRNSDKDSGLLYAEGGRNTFTQNEAPQMNVLVMRVDDKTTRVTARAVQAGQLYDWGSGKGNVGKFMTALRRQAN